jgi:hypothetical protein
MPNASSAPRTWTHFRTDLLTGRPLDNTAGARTGSAPTPAFRCGTTAGAEAERATGNRAATR